MNKPIRTYSDLQEEKQRLELLLQAQKELIRVDLQEMKAELKPAFNAFSFIGKLTTRDRSNPLLDTATSSVIDLVLKRVLLARAGWITKLLVPLFVKNFSSHVVADKKDSWIRKIFSFMGHKNGQEKKKEVVEDE